MSVDVYFLEAVVAVASGAVAGGSFIQRQHRKSVERIVKDVLEQDKKELEGIVKQAVDGAVRDAVHPIDNRLAGVEAQMDMFKNIAFDIARVLHHPEPGRQHIDELLDKFLDGSISDDEADELRGYLILIRDWEPGQDLAFPVFQGEQVAAAILLHTMKHALSRGNTK